MGNQTKCERKSLLSCLKIYYRCEESGQLNFIKKPNCDFGLSKETRILDIFYVDGHTEKIMIPHIKYEDKTIVFCADLLPTAGHIPLPYVMGYDTRPLLTLPEKAEIFEKGSRKQLTILFFEHDAHNRIITVQNTEKGDTIKRNFFM